MNKLILLACCIGWLSADTAVAGNKKDFAKQLDESFDKVQSAYFGAGFTFGAKCGLEVAAEGQKRASEGIAMSGDEMMAELEKCEVAAKKKYKVK